MLSRIRPLFPSAGRGRWFAQCSWAQQVQKGWGRGPPPGLSSTEVQAVAEGAGPGAASGALRPGAPASAPGQALAAAPVPAAASQFTLLVMRPCGGQDEAAAEGVLRQAPALGGSAGTGKPVGYLCEVAGDGEDEAGEDETDLLDTSDPPGGGESTASLEDLEDEETHSGGEGGSGGARRRGSGGTSMSKTCTYEGCSETTSQVAKQRKPWMCKKHRNKMYKDKYKKKKSDQALNCGGAAPAGSAGHVKLEVSVGICGSGRWTKKTPLLPQTASPAPAHRLPSRPGCCGWTCGFRVSVCPQLKFMQTCAKPEQFWCILVRDE